VANFTSLVKFVFSSRGADVVGVLHRVKGDLRGDRVGALAAISSAAACTPANIERKRFNRMYGYGSKALWWITR